VKVSFGERNEHSSHAFWKQGEKLLFLMGIVMETKTWNGATKTAVQIVSSFTFQHDEYFISFTFA